MWHDGLIYKINCIGITGNSLNLIESFLSNRFQWVVLNGQLSSWTSVYAGVPQGSILGPLFFLIYINDLSKDISLTVKLFADDTSIFSVVDDVIWVRGLVVSDLRSETEGSRFESSCQLCAEVSSLQ